jgi:hypothetical protein
MYHGQLIDGSNVTTRTTAITQTLCKNVFMAHRMLPTLSEAKTVYFYVLGKVYSSFCIPPSKSILTE